MASQVGIEPTDRVSYLVIKCHKVSYLYGYDGHKVSYFVINIHIVSYLSCQQLVSSVGNLSANKISVGKLVST